MKNRNPIHYRLVWSLLIAGLLITPTSGQQKSIEQKIEQYRTQYITTLQRQLATIRGEMRKVHGKQMRALGARAAYLKREIQSLERMKPEFFVPELTGDFELYSFGFLPRNGGGAPAVTQIIDDDEFVGEFVPDGPTLDEQVRSIKTAIVGAPEAGTARAFAAGIDGARALDRANAVRGHVWIKGVPTHNVNLGTKTSQLPFRNSLWKYYFEVIGTKDWNGMNIPVLEAYAIPTSGKAK